MTKKLPLSPGQAHVPAALEVFRAQPPKPLRYGWWRRWRDGAAGRVDGRVRATGPSASVGVVADTPWLRALAAECGNRVADERARSETLVAILDRERAEAQARLDRLQDLIADREAQLQRFKGTQITDAIVGPGEQYSPPDERLRRRVYELAKAKETARSDIASAAGEMRDAKVRVDVLNQQRDSHWTVLQQRVHYLREHYQRRAGIYVRGYSRASGADHQPPELLYADWVAAPLGVGPNNERSTVATVR